MSVHDRVVERANERVTVSAHGGGAVRAHLSLVVQVNGAAPDIVTVARSCAVMLATFIAAIVAPFPTSKVPMLTMGTAPAARASSTAA